MIILETKRLYLKQPTFNDFDDLLKLRTDPEVMRFTRTGVQTPEAVKNFIECAQTYSEKYGLGFYLAFEKETNDFVGQAGLFHVAFNENQPDIELAYRLHTKYWNKGYATELAKALINYGFNQLKLPKIVAMVHPDNEPSKKVLQKAGMIYGGETVCDNHQVPYYEIYNH